MAQALLLLFFSTLTFAQTPLYIGLDADMSAGAKEGGIAIRRGAMIAIEEINNAGGVLNRPLELIIKDHHGNPARGMANIKALSKQSDLVAVLGGVHTPVALKELPIIHNNKMIYLVPWAAGTPIVSNGYKPNYVFRISVRDEEAGKVLINQAKKLAVRKVGLLLERTGWGRSNEKSIASASAEKGLSIAAIEWLNWGQKDMTKEIASLVSQGAEAIILVANAPEGIVAVRSLLKLETAKDLPIIAHWGIASGDFVEEVGLNDLAKLNLYVLQTYSFTKPTNPVLNRQVIEAYQEMFDPRITEESIPGAVGTAHAYDLIHLLAKAITQANSIKTGDIRLALENLSLHKGLVKTYSPPFTSDKHDALWAEDYIISHYDSQGNLAPLKD
ncbi:MAG: branched-chain amino acid transport system substrate-binding protein [Oleispira sp.]|jgi:branched-chain amino acid transport system substrate-binding protein